MISRIINGKLILSGQIVSGRHLYIKDGKILEITAAEFPCGEEIDAGGNYVSPGFIDLHVHGGGGADFSDGTTEAAVKAANHHFRYGTTTIFPTLCAASAKDTAAALAAIARAANDPGALPEIGGVHIEGPYLSKSQCGALNPAYITPPVQEDYLRLLGSYGKLIRRWTFAPELEGAGAFLDALNRYGVVSSIGHTDAQYCEVMKAFNGGCRLVTHLYSCMSTVRRENGFRKLGVIETAYLLEDMLIEVIADGRHIPEELLRLIYKIKGDGTICLITDAIRCSGSEADTAEMGGVSYIIEDGVAKLPDRSAFAGSIATADKLIRFCVKDAGIPLESAVKMLTQNPARAMGLKGKGRIERNCDADLVIFDDEIIIKMVIREGRIYQ
jgi:N-acetylglucosamine-6-phosphate deacetylase